MIKVKVVILAGGFGTRISEESHLKPKTTIDIDYMQDDSTIFEGTPLENLAKSGQLIAYNHEGFWQPMDTLRGKNQLEDLWSSGKAPWKVWDQRKGLGQ